MERGARWVTVHEVAELDTTEWLSVVGTCRPHVLGQEPSTWEEWGRSLPLGSTSSSGGHRRMKTFPQSGLPAMTVDWVPSSLTISVHNSDPGLIWDQEATALLGAGLGGSKWYFLAKGLYMRVSEEEAGSSGGHRGRSGQDCCVLPAPPPNL